MFSNLIKLRSKSCFGFFPSYGGPKFQRRPDTHSWGLVEGQTHSPTRNLWRLVPLGLETRPLDVNATWFHTFVTKGAVSWRLVLKRLINLPLGREGWYSIVRNEPKSAGNGNHCQRFHPCVYFILGGFTALERFTDVERRVWRIFSWNVGIHLTRVVKSVMSLRHEEWKPVSM